MQKKPAERARDKINTRVRKAMIESGGKLGRLTDAQKKSPSQKRSENARKKDLKRAGIKYTPPDVGEDCHLCSKYPCGKTVSTCDERSMIHRCKQCGLKVRHRIDPVISWEYCPVCKENQ